MANDQMEGMENKLAGADGFVVFLLLLWFIYIFQSDPALCQTRCAAGRLQKQARQKNCANSLQQDGLLVFLAFFTYTNPIRISHNRLPSTEHPISNRLCLGGIQKTQNLITNHSRCRAKSGSYFAVPALRSRDKLQQRKKIFKTNTTEKGKTFTTEIQHRIVS